MLACRSAGSSARLRTSCTSWWLRSGGSGFSPPKAAAGRTRFCAERIVTPIILATTRTRVHGCLPSGIHERMDADVIVVGAGLAGLAATAELADAGKKVLLLDQEPEASLGGQAFWSFGGLMFVDSPEQRRLGIKDSHELAWQ